MRTLGPILLAAALLGAGCGGDKAAEAAQPPAQHFHSRPDLRPPPITMDTPARGTAPGYVFLAPKKKVAQSGPLIVDDRGRVVWFRPLRRAAVADFKVQRLRGHPVLTWWQGRQQKGVGDGGYMVLDSSYRTLRFVRPGRGLNGDIHEFLLTPRNTAIFTVYRQLPRDLSSLAGPRRGRIYEGVVQELDLATGRVLFEWHSAPHVALAESYAKPDGKETFDYFHVNAVDVDRDGDLLVSARNTHAVYKLRRSDGAIVWRLGGKRSDFAAGPGTTFAWQHDIRRQPDGTLTIFDNGANPKVEPFTRVLVLRLDVAARRVTLVRSYAHPRRLSSGSQGNAQFLPGGHVFVGWGSNPWFTEFARNGRVLLDAHFLQGSDSYRAFRFRWTGLPTGRPAAAREGHTVYASWNGATEVARWRVLAGDDPDALRPAASAAPRGFETAIRLDGDPRWIAVQALGRRGRVLGTSEPLEG